MADNYRAAADCYRPKPVRVLFIAESPPAYLSESKKAYFFFKENPGSDLLFATIIQAVLKIKYTKRGKVSKDHLLRCFKEKGYWLMDAVENPINKNKNGQKTSDKERKKCIEKGISNLLERIALLHAENGGTDIKIVLIKNLVYDCLSEPLRQAGYYVPQGGPIGFPRWYGDRATIKGIGKVIDKK